MRFCLKHRHPLQNRSLCGSRGAQKYLFLAWGASWQVCRCKLEKDSHIGERLRPPQRGTKRRCRNSTISQVLCWPLLVKRDTEGFVVHYYFILCDIIPTPAWLNIKHITPKHVIINQGRLGSRTLLGSYIQRILRFLIQVSLERLRKTSYLNFSHPNRGWMSPRNPDELDRTRPVSEMTAEVSEVAPTVKNILSTEDDLCASLQNENLPSAYWGHTNSGDRSVAHTSRPQSCFIYMSFR